MQTQRILARSRRSESKLGLDIKKLESNRSVSMIKSRKSLTQSAADSRPAARGSSNAMHLGRAACLVPEHDDLHKRIERLKDAREKEKEKYAAIKDEYEVKEQMLMAELEKLRLENKELSDKSHIDSENFERELAALTERHNELTKQVEINHQKELRDMYSRHEDQIGDKNKSIELLKQQVERLMHGQSKERQNQIDEMRKKLMGAAREANELRTEIMKLRRTDFPSSRRPESPPESNGKRVTLNVGICMNCVVLQQALSATHQALKSKMAELSRIDRTARSIKVGLELNDLALAQLDKADDER